MIAANIFFMAVIGFMVITGFGPGASSQKFRQIDAERINIIGDNGKPVLVLSNKTHMPGPTVNGKDYPRSAVDGREYFSGMLFFNELGDEVGSIIYAGLKKNDTNYSAVVHLSFDQYRQNQVLALDYNDKNGNRYAGMRVWDRPSDVGYDKMLDLALALKAEKPGTKRYDSLQTSWNSAKARGENGMERMFIGSKNEVPQIVLKDKQGLVRARLLIDNSTGDAHLEFLDASGKIQSRFPQ